MTENPNVCNEYREVFTTDLEQDRFKSTKKTKKAIGKWMKKNIEDLYITFDRNICSITDTLHTNLHAFGSTGDNLYLKMIVNTTKELDYVKKAKHYKEKYDIKIPQHDFSINILASSPNFEGDNIIYPVEISDIIQDIYLKHSDVNSVTTDQLNERNIWLNGPYEKIRNGLLKHILL